MQNNTCKSILKEYSDKKGYKVPPLYNTHTHENGPLQAYVSSVSFEGNMYYGSLSKSKKEAEQTAARVAIDSILGTEKYLFGHFNIPGNFYFFC
jgi:dsRNA-specific ribonuclease